MIHEIRMPRLDDDMVEGTVHGWIKKEGELVQKGEPVVAIETQKVNYEVEAPGSGILRIILVKEEELVPINTVLGIIAQPEDDLSPYVRGKKEEAAKEIHASPPLSSSAPAEPPSVAFGKERRIFITPVARKLAEEKGVDISQIKGTGPEGRITKEDILNFQPPKSEAPARSQGRKIRQTLPLSGKRKVIAERMLESWKTAPRAEHFMTADVTELVKIREKNRHAWDSKYGIRPSVNDFIVAATAKALRQIPIANAALRGRQIELYEDINISVAVALDKGLITPVLRGADRRDIFDIAREVRRLAELVRKGEHTMETLADSTFTVSNLGMFDVDSFIPVINPPEAAILAIGKIEKKPVIIEDAIAIRSLMTLCLAYDHRVLDGAVAAEFLQAIKRSLQNPGLLLPESR